MIFPTCVGNTKALGADSDKLTGLIVCFIGVGEIIGSLLSGFISQIGNDHKLYLFRVIHILWN
jgi:hypothetical protein